MKQVIIKKGEVLIENVPAPVVSRNSVLIRVVNSCISAGTEISNIQGSDKSILKKALGQPANITKAINMVKKQGFQKTYSKIKGFHDAARPSGYSISGIVLETGEEIRNFKKGDAVAAAGAGLANHSEYVNIPENLVAKLPHGMNFIKASTVTLGSIAMQGVRRCDLGLGEFCAIIGSGLLGLLALQILKLSGVRVIAVDLDEKRLEIAEELGAESTINPTLKDPIKAVENITGGYGADAVLFTAATRSSKPLSQSFKMCRKKGRVVLVGLVGMEINRDDMYSKELDFMMSTSYGPGRYDKNYEEKGLDYPYAYVRWTENRNMREYLRLLHSGTIKVDPLITEIYPIDQAKEAFQTFQRAENKPIMVILDYGKTDLKNLDAYSNHDRKVAISTIPIKKERINIALIGTGEFATKVHLPNIKRLEKKFQLHSVVDSIGHKAKSIAQQYKASFSTTNYGDVLFDKNIDLVLIATRHESHANLTLKALKAHKHVFVEKPLAITPVELESIKEFYSEGDLEKKPILMVGFNRRFSKYAREIKYHTEKRINPIMIYYRMNAGYFQPDHWVHESGGRIIGEACHIIDLMTFFTESQIVSYSVESLTPSTEKFNKNDNKAITLKYGDGSVATIHYFSVGNKDFPKEYMEIHFDENSIILDDYKSLNGYGLKINKISSQTCQKGHMEELERLFESLIDGQKAWPIELWDMFQTTELSFDLAK